MNANSETHLHIVTCRRYLEDELTGHGISEVFPTAQTAQDFITSGAFGKADEIERVNAQQFLRTRGCETIVIEITHKTLND